MSEAAKVYTRKGDDGTTGLLFGGRVRKDSAAIAANGDIDEAQAAMGVARAEAERGSELDDLLVTLERDLWLLMGEVATRPENRPKLGDAGRVSPAMVDRLEATIDDLTGRFEPVREFVVPGQARGAALLDVARAVVRRAERTTLAAALPPDSLVVPYLNRLSDLLWTMARWQEGIALPARRRDVEE